jgi:ATP-dependent DNA ligase
MSSDKRSFDDFENSESFSGSIDFDKNLYSFPTLYKTASTGKPRQWTIFCRLIKEDSKKQKITREQNWDLLTEDEVPIKQKYLKQGEKIDSGTIAEVWAETGIINMKISRSAATYILEPKNLGKKNERNVLQQALVFMRGKYLKKIDEGSSLVLDQLFKETKVSATTKFYPMLAKKFEDFEKKITYPVYVQYKLDGTRNVTFLDSIDKPTYQNVIMYTRSHKEYPYNTINDNIRHALLQLLINNYDTKNDESLFLDGELYNHNKSLQEINSEVRGQNSADIIQYWIYDHFYPSYDSETFEERNAKLINMYNSLNEDQKKYIKLVNTIKADDRESLDKIYLQSLAEKYEGVMIRLPNGPYLKSATKKSEQLRSKYLLKRKEVYDDEFEVVDFKQGDNGKEIGAIIWICKSKNKNGDTFSVTPNMPIKDRYKIYKECLKKFDSKYKGRLMTVEYRGLSDNNIPLQVKAVGFRDVK